MERKVKSAASIIFLLITGMFILQDPENFLYYFSVLAVFMLVVTIADTFLTWSKIDNGIWRSFGTTRYRWGMVAATTVMGIASILMSLDTARDYRVILDLNAGVFFGGVSIVFGLLGFKDRRIIFLDSFLHYGDFTSTNFKYREIIGYYIYEDKLELATSESHYGLALKHFTESELKEIRMEFKNRGINQLVTEAVPELPEAE